MIKTTIPGVINAFLEGEGMKDMYTNSTKTIECIGSWLTSNIEGKRTPFAYITKEDIVLIFGEVNCGNVKYYPHNNKVMDSAHKKGIKQLILRDKEVFDYLFSLSPKEVEEAISSMFCHFRHKDSQRVLITSKKASEAKYVIELERDKHL